MSFTLLCSLMFNSLTLKKKRQVYKYINDVVLHDKRLMMWYVVAVILRFEVETTQVKTARKDKQLSLIMYKLANSTEVVVSLI